MDIKHSLKPALKQLGIDKLRKHQQKPVSALLNGQDTIVIAATSSGKTLIYQLPALVHGGLTLVVEPTLALIYDQVRRLQERDIPAEYIDHTRKVKDVDTILKSARKGKLTFLYVTPERLQSEAFRDVMQEVDLTIIVVDECHCITEWGFSFREAYLQIGDFVDALPKRPILCACSATVMDGQLDELIHSLHMDSP